jgi:hypothetical protein
LFPAKISDLTPPNQPVIPSEDARAFASIATLWRASQSRDLQFASTVSRYRINLKPDSDSGASIPISYQPQSRIESAHPPPMLKLTMSLAYRIVFECPKDRKNINLEKKCRSISLSESDAMKMFGNEEIACTNPACGWHGKARRTRLLRILPFDWVLAPAT